MIIFVTLSPRALFYGKNTGILLFLRMYHIIAEDFPCFIMKLPIQITHIIRSFFTPIALIHRDL